MERRSADDRLLDYMIALEALYLPGERIELGFRLAARIAWTLCQTKAERLECYRFMKKMYSARGKVAHGEPCELLVQDVERVEGITRLSLKIWTDDRARFGKSALEDIVMG